MTFSLDITYCLAEKIGNQGGVSRQALNVLAAEFSEIHDDFLSARNSNLLPHLRTFSLMQSEIAKFRELLNFDGRIAFLGERGNLLAYKGHIENADYYIWLEDASPESLQTLLSSQEKVRLFVLDGPPWVRILSAELKDALTSIVVCIGDGAIYDGWSIEGAEVIESPGCSDVRFAPFSALGMALMLEDGASEEELAALSDTSINACLIEGLFENNSYVFASIFAALEKERNPVRPMLMLSNTSYYDWAKWAASVWAGITSQVHVNNGVRRRFGSEASIASISDEGAVQQLMSSPREQLSLLFFSEYPSLDVPNQITSMAWSLQNKLLDSFSDIMARDSRPICEMKIARNTPLNLLAVSYFWVHSALALSAFWVDDPLLLEGADKYRKQIDKLINNGG